MNLIDSLYTFFMYLVHPFKSHDFLLSSDSDFLPKKLGVYESLGASWAFVVINGIIRIWLINLVIISFYQFTSIGDGLIDQLYNSDGFTGYYFLILSTILDVIFYPLFVLFLIQFWEFIISFFGKVMKVEGDLTQKAQDVIAVSLSSHALLVVPIFGDMAQKLASLVLMYAGLRKQLNATPVMCFCIILTPILIMLGMIAFILLLLLLSF
jgi:hypothetical protein